MTPHCRRPLCSPLALFPDFKSNRFIVLFYKFRLSSLSTDPFPQAFHCHSYFYTSYLPAGPGLPLLSPTWTSLSFCTKFKHLNIENFWPKCAAHKCDSIFGTLNKKKKRNRVLFIDYWSSELISWLHLTKVHSFPQNFLSLCHGNRSSFSQDLNIKLQNTKKFTKAVYPVTTETLQFQQALASIPSFVWYCK